MYLLPPILHLLCSGTAAVSCTPCQWLDTQRHQRWWLSSGTYRVCLMKFVLLKFSSNDFANQINLHSRSKATTVSECNSSHSVSDMHNMCIAESLNRIYSHRLYLTALPQPHLVYLHVKLGTLSDLSKMYIQPNFSHHNCCPDCDPTAMKTRPVSVTQHQFAHFCYSILLLNK